MSYYPQFGDILNQQLAKLDRSPAWLARQLGINGSTVSRWLNEGARPGSRELVVRIAAILEMGAESETLLVAAGYGFQSIVTPQVATYATAAALLSTTIPAPGNLPQPFTPFVGRAAEIVQLTQQLITPSCRLLTLAGPGGIGKTRLAIEVARQLHMTEGAFPNGVFFVSLIELSAPRQIDVAIAATLRLKLDSERTARKHLQEYLSNKNLLLLLDNFEHLQEGAEGISRLLDDAPQVKILVTSRAALGVLGEWFYPVDGLKGPEEGVKPEELARYDSIHLFQLCAQQASPAFDLNREARDVARICRIVEGMPLAIELAAAWLRLLPCSRIAQLFAHNLVSLASPLPNMPPRHRSMHFVLVHAWQMLTAKEATVLEILALFQGGFDDAAAIEVAETDLLTLAALAQKSMIRLKQAPSTLPTGRARYTMHEMLRQFAGEEAAEHPEASVDALNRHSRYYLHWLQQQTPQLVNAGQYEAMALINEDFENVRAAWQWATVHHDFALLTLALEGLFHFCHIRGRVPDGVLLIQQSAEQVQGAMHAVVEDGNAEQRHLLGMLLARRGALYADSTNSEDAFPLMEQSLLYLDEPRARAFALGRFASCHMFRGNLAFAEELLHESLTLSRQQGDLLVQAYALFKMSTIAVIRGDIRHALAVRHECLAVFRTLGRPSGIAHTLCDVSWLEYMLGDYEAAMAHVSESLPISRRLGFPQGESLAFSCLGLISAAKGELEEAIAHLHMAIAIHRSIGNVAQMGYCLGHLGGVLVSCGSREKALEVSLEAITLARTLKNPDLLIRSLNVLGGAQVLNGNFVAARHSLMEALSSAWSNKGISSLIENLYYQAGLWVEENSSHASNGAITALCRSLAWLLFLQHHPACPQVYKDKAARIAATVEAMLPIDQASAAKETGKNLTLEEIVQFLLEQRE